MPVLVQMKQYDDEKASNGVWVRVCQVDEATALKHGVAPGWHVVGEDSPIARIVAESDFATVLVAQAGNVKHRRFLRDFTIQNRGKLREGRISPEALDENDMRGLVQFVLLGWNGFQVVNDKGKAVDFPYTKTNAMALLKGDAGFRDLISNIAMDDERYLDAASEKNSPTA